MSYRLPMPGVIYQPGAPTRWLTTFLHVPNQDILGCTEAEIVEIEAAAGRPLPLAYKQWLREAGRGVRSGEVASHFQRSYLTYPDMLNVRDVALEVIRDRQADESLLDWAFPFYNWEVYRICLLDLSRPYDDPPVLKLDEDTGQADWSHRSFSQFMAWEIFTLADALAI